MIVLRNGGVATGVDDKSIKGILARKLQRTIDIEVTVVSAEMIADTAASPDDYWLATFWSTAYAIARLCERGDADRNRVAYLVQDFEPGFYPWSDDYNFALSTYSEGFRHIVNSASLASYLTAQTGLTIDSNLVFSPDIDASRLKRSALDWKQDLDGRVRILVYGRPSHPRNLFGLTVESLTLWLESLAGNVARQLDISSAGASHDEIKLPHGLALRPHGQTTYDEYYRLLSHTDIGLALMYSPHPGHLPLEMPFAGIPTITNSLGSFRKPWVTGLEVVPPTADAIADALTSALAQAGDLKAHTPGAWMHSLGSTLDDALIHLGHILQNAPVRSGITSGAQSSGDGETGRSARNPDDLALLAMYKAAAAQRSQQLTQLLAQVNNVSPSGAPVTREELSRLRDLAEFHAALERRWPTRSMLAIARKAGPKLSALSRKRHTLIARIRRR